MLISHFSFDGRAFFFFFYLLYDLLISVAHDCTVVLTTVFQLEIFLYVCSLFQKGLVPKFEAVKREERR